MKNGKIEIETGVPLPHKGRWRALYPWRDMIIGDSFFVPGKTPKTMTGSAAHARKQLGFKFTLRSVDGGVRVWRIE